MSQQSTINLVNNGIYFIRKAQDNLEDDIKLSIVLFWTGVEILLKAPLASEHWSILITNNKRFETTKDKYDKGDFISISYTDSLALLRTIHDFSFSKEDEKSLNNIRMHRNRIMHFFNEEINDPIKLERVKIELAEAWFVLNNFLKHWRDIISLTRDSLLINNMDNFLSNTNDYYAKVKYNKIKDKIANDIQAGEQYRTCFNCTYESFHVDEGEAPNLIEGRCLVCNHNEQAVAFACEKCGSEVRIIADELDAECPICQHINPRGNAFPEENYSHKDYIDRQTPASCAECNSFESITEYHDGFICKNCLVYFDHLETCEYCNHSSSEVSEDSYAFGCEYCDGAYERF